MLLRTVAHLAMIDKNITTRSPPRPTDMYSPRREKEHWTVRCRDDSVDAMLYASCISHLGDLSSRCVRFDASKKTCRIKLGLALTWMALQSKTTNIQKEHFGLYYIGREMSLSTLYSPIITARYIIVQSAVLRSHVVCPSVCPTVTLVDHEHIGWKSWKLFALRSPRFIHLPTPRGTWRNFGEKMFVQHLRP